MIPRTQTILQTPNWQKSLANAFTDVKSLLEYLQLPTSQLDEALKADQQFPLRVPRGYAALMKKGDPNDPLLRQVLPLSEELIQVEGFHKDPVGDSDALAGTGNIWHQSRWNRPS